MVEVEVICMLMEGFINGGSSVHEGNEEGWYVSEGAATGRTLQLEESRGAVGQRHEQSPLVGRGVVRLVVPGRLRLLHGDRARGSLARLAFGRGGGLLGGGRGGWRQRAHGEGEVGDHEVGRALRGDLHLVGHAPVLAVEVGLGGGGGMDGWMDEGEGEG